MPRARPGDPLWPLLGSALVQALALARLLGRLQPAGDETALRARRPRHLVVRSRQGSEHGARTARIYRWRPGMARRTTRATVRMPRPTRVYAASQNKAWMSGGAVKRARSAPPARMPESCRC